MRRALSILALLIATAGAAGAQEPESRAAETAQRQKEKALGKGTSRHNWFEQRLLNIERAGGLGVTSGWFVTFGDIKSGSSFAMGPAYGKLFDNGALIHVKGAYSIRNFKLAQLTLQAPPMAGNRLAVNGRVRWQDAPTLAFYPIGADSTETRFDFSETKAEVSGRAMFRPVRFVQLGGGLSFEDFDTTHVTLEDSANAPLGLIFVPGSGSDPRYVHSYVSGALDWRDGVSYSRRGSLLQATFHDYRQQNGDGLSFRRVDAAAEQYIPILHGNWVIFLGLRASTTDTSDGNLVPFFLMPQLGGNTLRGFKNYRFRDRHSLVFTAEYRWYVQEFVDMAIFYDAGKVAPERSQLDFDGLKTSVGGGIRFHGPQTTAVRLEVARSHEGWRLIFGFSPVGGR
jgi:Omp85 superfamily domain